MLHKMDIRDSPPIYSLIIYTLLTYLVSWSCWGIWYHVGSDQPLIQTVLFIVGGFGPFAAALTLTWAEGRNVRSWLSSIFRVNVAIRYYFLALVIPVVAVLITTVVHVLIFEGALTPALVPAVTEYPIYLLIVLLFGGGQEEPGWRGYLLPRLQETYGALHAALVIGAVWAGWHLPLFILPGTIQAEMELWLYVPQVLAMSIILTWITNATKGSVLPAILLHAGANAVVNYYPIGGAGGAITPLGYGLLTATAVLMATILLIIHDTETLARVNHWNFSE